MAETLEQLRQDRDAYKQAYENICVFYKQLVSANQRLAESHEGGRTQRAADLPVCTCSTRPTPTTLSIDPNCPVHGSASR